MVATDLEDVDIVMVMDHLQDTLHARGVKVRAIVQTAVLEIGN